MKDQVKTTNQVTDQVVRSGDIYLARQCRCEQQARERKPTSLEVVAWNRRLDDGFRMMRGVVG